MQHVRKQGTDRDKDSLKDIHTILLVNSQELIFFQKLSRILNPVTI